MATSINLLKIILCVAIIPFIVRSESLSPLISNAATSNDVPPHVLLSICTHESQAFKNGKRVAWPWTINAGGKSYWFRSKETTLLFAENLIRQDKLNFDIGVCQINWFWHRSQVGSLRNILEPSANADYAAKYLKSLNKTDSWVEATGKYHSLKDTEKARQYAEKVFYLSVNRTH